VFDVLLEALYNVLKWRGGNEGSTKRVCSFFSKPCLNTFFIKREKNMSALDHQSNRASILYLFKKEQGNISLKNVCRT